MMNRISSYSHRVAIVLRLRGPLVGDVRARTLHGLVVGLLLYIWVVHIPIIVPLFVARKAGSTLANLYLTLIYGITLALLRRGSLRRASVLYLAGTWVAATVFVVFGGGIQSTALVHYVNLPILAAWLLGASAAGVVTAVCLGSSLILAVLQQSGYALPQYFPGTPFGNWSFVAMAMVGAVVPVLFVLNALNEALEKRQGAEEALRQANEKLEQRVRERTAQLEEANDFLQIHLGEQKRLEAGLELAARFPGENPNPVMRLGHGHLVDFANPAAKALLRTLGCAVAGEAPAHIAEPAVAALKDGVPRQIEKTYSERTYLFSFSPIPQWSYVNLYAIDITDRKRAEEGLRKSESQYRALFEHMSEGLAYCRMICENGEWRDFVYLAVNGTFETLTGLQNVVGRRVSELIPGIQASDPGLFEAYARVALTGKPEKFETFVEALGMWYSVSAYSPEKEYFVAVFEVITERKRAEDALRKSEERFRGLSEAMPLIVWSAGAAGAVEYVNPQTLRYGGVRLEDIGGWKWESFVHPDDLAPTAAGWRHALTAGESDQIEHRLRRADGEFRWHLTRAVPLRNEKGEVVQWIGSSTDIHDRKMAEQELERRVAERTAELARSTALLETVTSNAPVVLFATDAKGTFTVHTGQGVTASGREPGELVGKNCRELLPERAQAVEHIHRALAGKTFTAVLEGPHDSTFETRYNPLRDAHGNVTGMMAVAVDITEAKRAKEGLEKANAYNRSLLEASLDPLVTISPNGKITDVNTATEKVTGRLREELIGADFSDYFTDPEKARLGYQQAFKEGLVQDYELEVRHRDGSTTPVLYNASVYRDQGGEVVGVFAAARDITTRKRAEEEVRRLNEELEQRVRLRTAQLEASNKEIESFSYSVSHDLRAPLRAMDGFSRILLEEYRSQLPSKAQRYLDFVRDGAAHMGNLIDGLLALSRLGRQELKRRPVEVAEIVRQSLGDLQADVEGSAAEFVVGSLPSCDADPLLLRQVFVNLLSNALKFSRKQEKVRIQIGALRAHEAAQAPLQVLRLLDPHSWVYYVRDNGVGFDMRYADQLFGVFQRLHRQEEFKGTGIGLATVQQIIHKHGGQVWAEAEVGKGATFYFTLGQAIGESHNSNFGTPE